MKFEVGKFYRTRNGSKVRLVDKDRGSGLVFEVIGSGSRFFSRSDGRYYGGRGVHPLDVVEPWTDSQTDRDDAMEMILLHAVRAIGVGRALEVIEDRAYEALEEKEKKEEE